MPKSDSLDDSRILGAAASRYLIRPLAYLSTDIYRLISSTHAAILDYSSSMLASRPLTPTYLPFPFYDDDFAALGNTDVIHLLPRRHY